MSKISIFNLKSFSRIDDYFLIDGFYPFCENKINESTGVPNFLMQAAVKIINKIISLKHLSKESFNKIIIANLSSVCEYFNNAKVTVNYFKTTEYSIKGNAKYIPGNFAESNDIEIEINIYGPKLDPMVIGPCLCHELLHVYEDKILYVMYNISVTDKLKKNDCKLWMYAISNKSKILYETYIFAYLMHYLNSSEINVNAAQIEYDCIDFIEVAANSVDSKKMFKRTRSYKEIAVIEEMIYDIDNFTVSDENKIIDEFNSLKKNNELPFTEKHYSYFKKQLMQSWEKYQYDFRIIASKIIYKLFKETHRGYPIY